MACSGKYLRTGLSTKEQEGKDEKDNAMQDSFGYLRNRGVFPDARDSGRNGAGKNILSHGDFNLFLFVGFDDILYQDKLFA